MNSPNYISPHFQKVHYPSSSIRDFRAAEGLNGGQVGDPVTLVNVTKTEYMYKYNDYGGKSFEKAFDEHTARSAEWQDELGLNMYSMDMRQYDPAIARWVVQDPIVHLNQSPYSSFDGNPVYWADPSGAATTIREMWDKTPEGGSTYWVNTGDGNFEQAEEDNNPPDDHFDKNGNYMYTDTRTTNNIIIHPFFSKPDSYPFSSGEFDYEVQLKDYYFATENFNVLLAILNFYGPMVGVFPENLQNESFSIAAFYETRVEGGLPYGKLRYYNNEKGSYHKYAIGTGGNGRVTVMLRNGKVSSLINDKFNLQLFLYHEGGTGGHLGMPNATHATIYRNQMEHPLFKMTTPEFKKHVKDNYKMYGGE